MSHRKFVDKLQLKRKIIIKIMGWLSIKEKFVWAVIGKIKPKYIPGTGVADINKLYLPP